MVTCSPRGLRRLLACTTLTNELKLRFIVRFYRFFLGKKGGWSHDSLCCFAVFGKNTKIKRNVVIARFVLILTDTLKNFVVTIRNFSELSFLIYQPTQVLPTPFRSRSKFRIWLQTLLPYFRYIFHPVAPRIGRPQPVKTGSPHEHALK